MTVKDLTLEEKIELLTGADSFSLSNLNGKLKKVKLADGPIGVHVTENGVTSKTTATPSTYNVANTWNDKLSYLCGQVIANDCIDLGVDVLLAPGVNVKRSALCGRNFEYFSEDPYLSGKMGRNFVEGVQSLNVGTSLKHYLLNNREYERMYSSSEVDERTINEIYLPAFEETLKAKPYTVMCSYNLINGIYASENKKYLDDVLRKRFGFDGLIMSDWGAVHNSARAIKATLDLRMPYEPQAKQEILDGLNNGYITESEIDERVEKVLQLIEKTSAPKKCNLTVEERDDLALKIAEESIVMLKNDGVLPLKTTSVVVEGRFNKENAYGHGSSVTLSRHEFSSLESELYKQLNCDNGSSKLQTPFNNKEAYYRTTTALMRTYQSDAVVLAVGTGNFVEGEGWDRNSISLSKYDIELILETAKYNENVIVVIYAGSAVDVSPFIDKVKAVLVAGYGGQAINKAVAKVLTGKINPSGKLSETFIKMLEDTPFSNLHKDPFNVRYSEGVFVGYRYYDKYDTPINFPFGYGLSYSNFLYHSPSLTKLSETEYEISYKIKNTSSIDGKEISQVYIKDVFSHVSRPEKELRAYAKTFIKAGEEVTVSHRLTARDFSYYSTELNRFYLENGDFEILIGASSHDIKLKVKLNINLPFETQYSQM